MSIGIVAAGRRRCFTLVQPHGFLLFSVFRSSVGVFLIPCCLPLIRRCFGTPLRRNFNCPDSPLLAWSAVRLGSLGVVLDALCVGFSMPLRNFARFDSPPFVDHLAQMESPVSINGLMHVGSLVFVHSCLRLDSLLLVYGICRLESSVVIVDFILCGSALLL